MRDRLIDLIVSADISLYGSDKPYAEVYADFLLENGVIVLPCKVGTTVFFVGFDTGDDGAVRYCIDEGEIVSFSFDGEYLWAYARYESGLTFWHKDESFGINTFFTKEEAETALAERSGK